MNVDPHGSTNLQIVNPRGSAIRDCGSTWVHADMLLETLSKRREDIAHFERITLAKISKPFDAFQFSRSFSIFS